MKKLCLIFMGIMMFTLAGCGGGGGSSSNETPAPVTMVLKVSTMGVLPAGTSIAAVGFTVTLPAGVTVATNQDGSVADGVVVPSGVISSSTAVPFQIYKAQTAELVIGVGGTVGFATGEFISITVTRPGGSTALTAADFPVSNFVPVSVEGFLDQPIAGITSSLTVQYRPI